MSNARLTELWDKGESSFAVNPPNAALSGEVDGESILYSYAFIQGDEVSPLESVVAFTDSYSWRGNYTGPMGGLP